LACGGPPTAERAPAVEIAALTAALSGAEVSVEPRTIDFGTGSSEPLLLSGFSYSETAEDGTTFAWSDRPTSTLALFVAERRPLRARLRLLPLVAERQPQAVQALLNGVPAGGEIELPAGWSEIEVELPVAAQRTGDNRFELRYRWTASPRSGSRRQSLAVAWDWLRLIDGAPQSQRSTDRAAADTELPRADGDRLTLPPGAQVDFFLPLPAGARLRFERLSVRHDGALRVELEPRGAPLREVAQRTSSSEPATIDLGLTAPALVRLRLRTPAGAAAVLDGARLTAPTPPDDRGTQPATQPDAGPGPPATGAAAAAPRRPNLLIYLVDTLRADHLGVYGYRRPTSPRLDAFAGDAVLFEQAFAQSSWTKASVASIFSGVWPRAHGLHNPEDAFSAALPTLPELLRTAGYDTAAIATNAYISREAGFGRGFDHFVYLPHAPNRSTNVHRKAVEWLDARRGSNRADAPFFLYLHTIDPHAPYAPPAIDRQRFAPAVPLELGSVPSLRAMMAGRVAVTAERRRGLLDLYDGEVAFNDRQFGRLVEELKRRGLYDDTLIVFVSDHGEGFDEHGKLGHGWDLFRETLQVPLLIKPPGGALAGRRVRTPVQHIDLLPTLLAAAGAPAPAGLAGRDLLALAADADPEPAPLFSFLRYSGRTGASVVLETGAGGQASSGQARSGWHLTEPLTHSFGAAPQLFDLAADPGEQHDLLAAEPVVAGYLRSLLRHRLAGSDAQFAPGRFEVDAETRKQLQALGYLD
jgi:arylsulfatase A-like enzyme